MSDSSTTHELKEEQRQGLSRLLPSLDWITKYNWPKAQSDALVAFFVAALLVPQAMAYALIGYVIALGAANSLAGRNRQAISPDHESVALGMGNLGSARIVVEGPESASGRMRSTERRDVDDTDKSVLVLRVDENLYFANSRYCEQAILREVADRPQVSDVVLDLKVVGHIDASALVMLERLNASLQEAGVRLSVAHARKPVLLRLRHIGFMRQLDEPVAFESSQEAVDSLSGDREDD